MEGNVLVVHGGGPTPVINASLYGVVEEAKKSGKVEKVYAAMGGTGAIFSEDFLDLLTVPEAELKLLLQTPATAIGSSRYALWDDDYKKMPEIFKKYNIRYVLLNGGNGTMDTCGRIHKVCAPEGIRVIGIPKTIDNDIAVTDHTPGYGSAARYIAATTHEVGEDVKSLLIHLLISPDEQLLREYQEKAKGNIRYITVSPEVLGVPEMIPVMKELGMTVAIGHSGADYDTVFLLTS